MTWILDFFKKVIITRIFLDMMYAIIFLLNMKFVIIKKNSTKQIQKTPITTSLRGMNKHWSIGNMFFSLNTRIYCQREANQTERNFERKRTAFMWYS